MKCENLTQRENTVLRSYLTQLDREGANIPREKLVTNDQISASNEELKYFAISKQSIYGRNAGPIVKVAARKLIQFRKCEDQKSKIK